MMDDNTMDDMAEKLAGLVADKVVQRLRDGSDVLQPDYVTAGEAAALLKVSKSTVVGWCRSGKLVATKISPRMWRISRDSVDRILNGDDLDSDVEA